MTQEVVPAKPGPHRQKLHQLVSLFLFDRFFATDAMTQKVVPSKPGPPRQKLHQLVRLFCFTLSTHRKKGAEQYKHVVILKQKMLNRIPTFGTTLKQVLNQGAPKTAVPFRPGIRVIFLLPLCVSQAGVLFCRYKKGRIDLLCAPSSSSYPAKNKTGTGRSSNFSVSLLCGLM